MAQEVQHLAETPIAEDDLRAMKGALFIALIAATESPTERADALALTGGLRDPVRLWAAARALTAVDLQRMARSLSRGRSVVQMRPGATSRQAAVMVSEEGECR